MIRTAAIPASRDASTYTSTGRQRSIRRRAGKLALSSAVRLAVDVCFGFRCRAIQGKSLWSETERVWMGRDTFLHWAIWLEDIDIPWVVATATGAPEGVERLRDAVHTELTSYWTDRLAALPRRKCPHWLPLP